VGGEEGELIARSKLLDEVSEARPLARMQEELEHVVVKGEDEVTDVREAVREGIVVEAHPEDSLAQGLNLLEQEKDVGAKSSTPPGSPLARRKPLLNAHDDELDRVARVSPSTAPRSPSV
jgi:hypothetical protein